MKRALRLLGLLSPLLALACTSTLPGPPEMPFTPPDQWQAGVEGSHPAAGPPSPWWQDFGDPVLDSLIEEALANSPTLEAARARWVAAVGSARLVGGAARPQANLSLDGARRRQNFIGLPIPDTENEVLSNTSTSVGLALGAAWEIDLWGRLGAGTAAAQARSDAAAADLAAVRLSLAGQIARGWFAWLEANQQLALANETLEIRLRTREQIESRYRLGLRPALDLRLARASEADAEAQLASRSQAADLAARHLEVLLARYPSGDSLAGEASLADPPRAIAATLPAQLVTQRPDIIAAELRLAAAGLDVRGARAALYPRLSLTASLGRSAIELEDIVDNDFSVWSLAAGLLQPLFQGGRLRAAVDVAEARRQQEAAGYIATALNAFAEVERSLAAERFTGLRLEALTRTAREARAASELAERRYRSGLTDYLSVLEAQRQAALSQSQLLSVRRQALDNRVDLHLALGGDHDRVLETYLGDERESP